MLVCARILSWLSCCSLTLVNFQWRRDRPSPLQPEIYTQPVQLASEAVLARCGEEERLLVRVQPLQARSPPEPPLLSVQPSSSSKNGSSSGAGGLPSADSGEGGGYSMAPGPLNVMVFFIDCLSRRHFFRRLPATAKALEGIHTHRRADLYQVGAVLQKAGNQGLLCSKGQRLVSSHRVFLANCAMCRCTARRQAPNSLPHLL